MISTPHQILFALPNQEEWPWFQAYAAMLMKSVVFWVITRRRVVIIYRRFGTAYRSHLHESRFQEERKPVARKLVSSYWLVVTSHVSPPRCADQFPCYRLSFLLESWPVKVGPIRCPETSVNNYHTTPCNYPEDRRFHLCLYFTFFYMVHMYCLYFFMNCVRNSLCLCSG
jgi:hypothetical protein